MSEDSNSQVLRRWFTVGAVVVVLWALSLILWPLRMPIVWAAVLAFLLHPLQRHLSRRFGNRPAAAAGVLTALTPLALFTPLTLLIIAFAQQVGALATLLQQNPDVLDISRWLDAQAHPVVAGWIEWLSTRFDLQPLRMREIFAKGVERWAGSIAGISGQLLLNTAGIAFMVTGSVAMNYYAQPRMTRDCAQPASRRPRSGLDIIGNSRNCGDKR